MNSLIIYYNDGSRQVVKPSEKFSGNWKDLVLHITQSTHDNLNYKYFIVT